MSKQMDFRFGTKGSSPSKPSSGDFGIMRDAQSVKLQSLRTGDGLFAYNLATNPEPTE